MRADGARPQGSGRGTGRGGDPHADPAGSRQHPGRHRGLSRAATIAALGSALLLGACGDPAVTLEELESFPASSTPAASTSSTSSTASSPSSAPATSPAAAEGGIRVDGLVEVLVTDLVIRTGASIDPDSSSMIDDRLTTGDRAFVVDGPVEDSGYTWYQVAPLSRSDGSGGSFGWIAVASREGEPWVQPVEPACPPAVDLASVLALQPLERLVCFGDQRLVLSSAQVTCGVADGPWIAEPAWLAGYSGCGLAAGDAVLPVRTPPGGRSFSSGPVTVRGHFDDPASATCTITTVAPDVPAPPREHAVLLCRTQFVSEG